MTTTMSHAPAPNAAAMDPLEVSLAAYAPQAQRYAELNAERMAVELAQFTAPLSPADDVVLDAGCGAGRDLVRLAEWGFCAVGVDLCAEFVAAATAATDGWPVRVELGDLRALPFDDDEFAGVWACASLVHLSPADAATALAELARVGRPGAPVHVSVKAGDRDASGFVDSEFGRRYYTFWSETQLRDAAVAAGLSVVSVDVDDVFVNLWAVA
jgi:SAM-dependent methyltransferase